MPGTKRARKVSWSKAAAIARAFPTGRYQTTSTGGKRRRVSVTKKMFNKVNALIKQIETKEGSWRVTNVSLPHNNLVVLNNSTGSVFNPFESGQGIQDPNGSNVLSRIGDQISVKGIKFKFFVECSLGRAKVYFRFMLVRCAKGDTPTRATFFKDACGNKMIDQYNRERYTIVAQKTFNCSAPNNAALSVNANGTPATGTPVGITGNKVFSMWIPGKKFGRNGVIQYESGTAIGQVKFYDYRLCVVAYDWYGTPQDINNVGFINDGYVKVYFKDA